MGYSADAWIMYGITRHGELEYDEEDIDDLIDKAIGLVRGKDECFRDYRARRQVAWKEFLGLVPDTYFAGHYDVSGWCVGVPLQHVCWDSIDELDAFDEQLHIGGPLRELAEKLGEGWEGPRLYIGVNCG